MDFIEMPCPVCRDMIQAPFAAVGQMARCPCGALFQLPELVDLESTPAVASSTHSAPARSLLISNRAAIACCSILTVGLIICVYLLRSSPAPATVSQPLAQSQAIPAVTPVAAAPLPGPDHEATIAKVRDEERRIAEQRRLDEERRKDEQRKAEDRQREEKLKQAEDNARREVAARIDNAKGFVEGQAMMILGFSYPTATLTETVFDEFKLRNGGFELRYSLKYFSPFEDNGFVRFSFRFDAAGRIDSIAGLNRSAFLPPGTTITFALDVIREEIKNDPELQGNPLLGPAMANADAMQMLLAFLQTRQ